MFLILGPLRWVLVQSESVELRILLSWSNELNVCTLLPLHRAFHVARAWSNSKYEDINEILYRPSIVPGSGAEQVWGGGGGGGGVKSPLSVTFIVGFCMTQNWPKVYKHAQL